MKAAIAESFERIHRSNLIGMGIVPLVVQVRGRILRSHGLTGFEKFDVARHLGPDLKLRQELTVKATSGRRQSHGVQSDLPHRDTPRSWITIGMEGF